MSGLAGFDLTQYCPIFDVFVVGEQEGLAEDYRQGSVAFKRQEDLLEGSRARAAAVGDDTKVSVVRFHEDVRAAEVDLVGAQFALNDEETFIQGASAGDL
jgi:hypothetical protein